MKLSRNRILIAASIVALVGVGSASAVILTKEEEVSRKEVSVVQVEAVEKTEPAKVEASPDPVNEAPVVTETPAVVPVPVPVVLSAQEYAEIYLNLSLPVYQICFDALLQRYPERFTEDVREANIKALRVFGAPCAGVGEKLLKSEDYPVISPFDAGGHGAFFDSESAKNQH